MAAPTGRWINSIVIFSLLSLGALTSAQKPVRPLPPKSANSHEGPPPSPSHDNIRASAWSASGQASISGDGSASAWGQGGINGGGGSGSGGASVSMGGPPGWVPGMPGMGGIPGMGGPAPSASGWGQGNGYGGANIPAMGGPGYGYIPTTNQPYPPCQPFGIPVVSHFFVNTMPGQPMGQGMMGGYQGMSGVQERADPPIPAAN